MKRHVLFKTRCIAACTLLSLLLSAVSCKNNAVHTDRATTAIPVTESLCRATEPLSTAKAPPAFRVIDDVIYSADGKTLYQYNSQETSFILPEQVLYIAPNAFEKSALTNITFNDSLQYIGSYAFCDTAIRAVNLPDSVIQIDFGAFSGCTEAVVGSVPSTCNVLYGFRRPGEISDVYMAPFFLEKYNDTVFPGEAIQNEDCFFMNCARDLSTAAPGSEENELPDWQQTYYASSPLEELSHHVDFQLLSPTEAVMIFTGWWNKVTVFQTDDGGMTWHETPTRPTPTYARNHYVDSIWLDRDTALLYYYKVYSRAYTFLPDEELVQITLDGGKTWKLLTRGDFVSAATPNGCFDGDVCHVNFEKEQDAYQITFGLQDGSVSVWTVENGIISACENTT